MNQILPKYLEPRLESAPFKKIAKCIIAARSECDEYRAHEQNDTNWAQGCRTREWERNGLRKLAQENDAITIDCDRGQKFEFTVNGIRMKFYHDNGTIRKDIRGGCIKELNESLLFRQEVQNVYAWRLIIRVNNPADSSNNIPEDIDVAIVAIDAKGTVRCDYTIPVNEQVATVWELDLTLKQGIVIDKAQVRKKKDHTRKKQD